MTQTIAIGNQKGGVGKTTTTLGLASADAHRGLKVAVIDLDAQCNTTTTLIAGATPDHDLLNVYDAMISTDSGTLGEVLRPSSWDGVDIAPAHSNLDLFERENLMSAEHRLFNAIDGGVLDKYDRVYIDLPPHLGRLTLNGLVAADEVLIVTIAEAWAISGVPRFLNTINAVRSQRIMNPALKVAGILVNAFDKNQREHAESLQMLRETYPDDVLNVQVGLYASAKSQGAYARPLYETKGSNWRRVVASWEILSDQISKVEVPA